jgi:RNA recognition motif-containing protein
MNIYIGNLLPDVGEAEIATLFEKFGEVNSVNIIMEKDGNRSRGYGFVSMDSQDAGLKAMQALDNSRYRTRNIEVSEATTDGAATKTAIT